MNGTPNDTTPAAPPSVPADEQPLQAANEPMRVPAASAAKRLLKKPLPTTSGDWLTAAEAASHLRLPSVNALYQRVARGQIKALRLGRQMRFRRRDLDGLVRAA
jgi:excisionase family DNA binding protein